MSPYSECPCYEHGSAGISFKGLVSVTLGPYAEGNLWIGRSHGFWCFLGPHALFREVVLCAFLAAEHKGPSPHRVLYLKFPWVGGRSSTQRHCSHGAERSLCVPTPGICWAPPWLAGAVERGTWTPTSWPRCLVSTGSHRRPDGSSRGCWGTLAPRGSGVLVTSWVP